MILLCSSVMYFVLYPVVLVCECWILFRIMDEVSSISKIIIGIITLGYSIGISLHISVDVVALADLFIVKPGHLVRRPTYRTWIPVSDGSLGL